MLCHLKYSMLTDTEQGGIISQIQGLYTDNNSVFLCPGLNTNSESVKCMLGLPKICIYCQFSY